MPARVRSLRSDAMQVTRVSARAGSGWVAGGFRLLRKAPLPIAATTMGYMLILALLMYIPKTGGFLPLLLTPLLMVGLMDAVRAVDQGRVATPAMLLNGIKEQGGRAAGPLMALGLVNAATTLAALAASYAIDGGALWDMPAGRVEDGDPRLADGNLTWSILAFLAIYVPAQMSLWYAPLFVAWDGLSAPKALFFSLIAVARNKWAFLQYMVGWFFVLVLASVVIQVLNGVLGGTPVLLSMMLMPVFLIIVGAVYSSIWPTYRDTVRPSGPPVSPAPAPLPRPEPPAQD